MDISLVTGFCQGQIRLGHGSILGLAGRDVKAGGGAEGAAAQFTIMNRATWLAETRPEVSGASPTLTTANRRRVALTLTEGFLNWLLVRGHWKLAPEARLIYNLESGMGWLVTRGLRPRLMAGETPRARSLLLCPEIPLTKRESRAAQYHGNVFDRAVYLIPSYRALEAPELHDVCHGTWSAVTTYVPYS